MKKMMLYGLIIIIASLMPAIKSDISNLEPISCVAIGRQEGVVELFTDSLDYGRGQTVEAALKDMKSGSEGVVYLDTAQFLLVSKSAEADLRDMSAYLKGDVKIAQWNGTEDLTLAAKYMESHRIGVKLKEWRSGTQLPTIYINSKKT